MAAGKPGRPVRISLPENAELVWPYNPWNCYNLKTDRFGRASGWGLILRIPVGPEGTEIRIGMVE